MGIVGYSWYVKGSYEKKISRNGTIYYAPIKSLEERTREWRQRGSWMPEGNMRAIKEAYEEQKQSIAY